SLESCCPGDGGFLLGLVGRGFLGSCCFYHLVGGRLEGSRFFLGLVGSRLQGRLLEHGGLGGGCFFLRRLTGGRRFFLQFRCFRLVGGRIFLGLGGGRFIHG